MVYKKVLEYSAGWRDDIHQGRIILKLEGEQGQPVMGWYDPPEFQAVIDLLRNEKPVYYDREQQVLHTGQEPVGEGEPKEFEPEE